MIFRLCLLIMLSLCSSTANSQQKGNPAVPCFRALADDPRFAPLREKVALGGALEEMRNFTKSAERASERELPVLTAWSNARDSCHRLEAGYYATRDIEIQALARDHFAAVQALIAELQSGKFGYGEFGRRRVDLYEKVTRLIEDVRKSILPPKLPPPHTTVPSK